MKTKLPFKYNQVAALLMLAPLGMAHAAEPFFLESSTPSTDFELLFTTHDSASNSMLLDIDDNNNVHLGFTSSTDSVPMYSRYENGVVTSQPLDVGSNETNGYPTVLVNPAVDNGLVTVYIQDGVGKVATSSDNGTSWTISANTMDISIITDADANQRLARIKTSIDSQGKVYVAYTTTTAGVNGKFHINSYDTTTDTWADETGEVVDARLPTRLFFDETDGAMDIVVGPDDKPYAIYRRIAGHNSSIYTPDDTGTWQSFQIFSSSVDRVFRAESTTISVDNEGSLYVFVSGDDSTVYHADLFKITEFEGVNARGTFVAVDLLDKLSVTPNIQNTVGNTEVLPNSHIKALSRPVFDSNNNIYLAFTDTSVADTKDFIVARIDAETAEITRLNNNYAAVTGLDTPSAGFNTVDLAIDELDRPVVVFNEGTPTVMRASLVSSGESLTYVYTGNGLVVGSLTGIDSDGDVITYNITDDLTGDAAGSAAALFTVDTTSNELKFIAPFAGGLSQVNLTVEATANGESTSVDILINIDVGSDADGDGVGDDLDAFPNDPTEQFDTDGDGYGDNFDPAPNNPNDVSAPVISFVDGQAVDLVINATGFTTQLTSAQLESFVAANISATDELIVGDGREANTSVAIVPGTNTQLTSGVNTIQLSSTDSTGNIGFFDINVVVNPVIQLGADLVVETGTTLTIPVKLLGQAAAYPVELTYSVTPSSTGIMSEELTLTINDTDSSPVISYTLAGEQSGETIVVTLIGAMNAVVVDEVNDVGELVKPTVIANVISGNIAPVVTLTVAQAEADVVVDGVVTETDRDPQNVSTIAGAAGLVTVTANISDVNTGDEHCITFTSTDGALTAHVDPTDSDPSDTVEDCQQSNTFIFEPSLLESGTYSLAVTALENNTDAPFTTESSIELSVIADLVDVVVDSDSDGIPDTEESITTMNDATQLAVMENEAPLQVAAGFSLSLGNIAKNNTDVNGFVASVAREQVQADLHFLDISTITNFNISGLQQLGDSVSVVLPLADGVIIPTDAVYRKYIELNEDWFDFVVDDNNQLASALKDAQGNCPTPDSLSYVAGLAEGNNCIQLTIEDGGLNDGDSIANGTIVDPGVLATENDNIPPVIVSLVSHATNSGEEFNLNAVVSDFEGDDITYTWTQVDTDSALLADVVDASAGVFIAPVVEELTDLTFSLTINDGLDDSEPQQFIVKVATINLKPEHDVDRKSGSFGWVMGLFTLAGLVTRRLRKHK